MNITIKNDIYEVMLNTFGAEINAFCDRKTGTKYVFEGPASVWKYHAPLLFPHVGRIRDGFMTSGGKRYNLAVNGFSRDMEHKLIRQTATIAEFELTESENTAERFPWKFSLKTYYELIDNCLVFVATVSNTDEVPIKFSIGGHTAFCCPRNTDPDGTTCEDYQYEFEKKEPLTSIVLSSDGYLASNTNGVTPVERLYGEKEQGIVPITPEGFGNGHFITKNTSDWVGIRNKKDGSIIKVNTKQCPYIMLWQNAGVPAFDCIEPWYGLSDAVNTDHKWEHKKGLISLAPGKSFSFDQSITIEK